MFKPIAKQLPDYSQDISYVLPMSLDVLVGIESCFIRTTLHSTGTADVVFIFSRPDYLFHPIYHFVLLATRIVAIVAALFYKYLKYPQINLCSSSAAYLHNFIFCLL